MVSTKKNKRFCIFQNKCSVEHSNTDFFNLGNDKLVDLLTEKGVELNAKDVDGNTPLHLAAMSGNGVNRFCHELKLINHFDIYSM